MRQTAVRGLLARGIIRSRRFAWGPRTDVANKFLDSLVDTVADGRTPQAGLIDVNGTLYGTTSEGGSFGCGTVFQLSTSGKAYKILYNFRGGRDGANPVASLIYVNGKLFGTTENGGIGSHFGTVFSVSLSGKEHVLYRFGSSSNSSGVNGTFPEAALIFVNGKFYGTTSQGGASNYGTVFELSTSGRERVLHSFDNSPDGANPAAPLIYVNDKLYGTTVGGGTYYYSRAASFGTVFELNTSGKGYRILHNFKGDYNFGFS